LTLRNSHVSPNGWGERRIWRAPYGELIWKERSGKRRNGRNRVLYEEKKKKFRGQEEAGGNRKGGGMYIPTRKGHIDRNSLVPESPRARGKKGKRTREKSKHKGEEEITYARRGRREKGTGNQGGMFSTVDEGNPWTEEKGKKRPR